MISRPSDVRRSFAVASSCAVNWETGLFIEAVTKIGLFDLTNALMICRMTHAFISCPWWAMAQAYTSWYTMVQHVDERSLLFIERYGLKILERLFVDVFEYASMGNIRIMRVPALF